MKRERHFKENLAAALEVPEDLALKDSIVTMTGKTQLSVENYRGIVCYTPEEIRIRLFHGCLKILGKNLNILSYSQEEIRIRGQIFGITVTKGQ